MYTVKTHFTEYRTAGLGKALEKEGGKKKWERNTQQMTKGISLGPLLIA